MLVSVSQAYGEGVDVYEIARYAWKVDVERARRYDLVLAHSGGVVVGSLPPDDWLLATTENFPGRVDVPGRWGFVGRVAEPEVDGYYVGKGVPDRYRTRGSRQSCALLRPRVVTTINCSAVWSGAAVFD